MYKRQPLHDGARRVEGDRTFSIGRVTDEGWPVWSFERDGAMEHVLDESTIHPADVRMGHLQTSTGAESIFRHHLMVMKHTPRGHVTVTEHGTTVRTPGRPTRQRELAAPEIVTEVRDLGVRITEEEDAQLTDVVTRMRG